MLGSEVEGDHGTMGTSICSDWRTPMDDMLYNSKAGLLFSSLQVSLTQGCVWSSSVRAQPYVYHHQICA